MAGWGDFAGYVAKKVSEWIPSKREFLNNKIDKLKKEMNDVAEKKPFDAVRYERLAAQLRDVESKERRAS